MVSWLKIFFKDLLGFTDGLNGQFLIAHRFKLHATEPPIQVMAPNLCSTIGTRPRNFPAALGKRDGDGRPAKGWFLGESFGVKMLILLALRLVSWGPMPGSKWRAASVRRS